MADAKIVSQVLNRSVAGQIEYWAKIGKIAEENPDLTFEFIKNILIAKQEVKEGRLENIDFWENKHGDLSGAVIRKTAEEAAYKTETYPR